MSSVREQIVARMAAALAVLLAPGAIPVYRSRADAFDRGASPAVVISPADEETQPLADLWEVSRINVHVEIIVRGDVWDTLADPIIIAVHTLLMGDAPLAALCSKIRRSSAKWEAHEADQTAGVLTQTYHLIYHTQTDQL